MKKQLMQLLSLLLTIFMLLSIFTTNVRAEPVFDRVREEWIETDDYSPDKYVWDDEIGTFVYRWDNISWAFDEETGVLEITGQGSMMKDDILGAPGPRVIPWYKYRDKIKKAIVGEGITELCIDCFYGQNELTEVNLPSTLKTIPEDSFSKAKKLEKLVIPNSVTQISDGAFYGTDGLKELVAPHTAFKNGRAYKNGMTNLQKIVITNGDATDKTLSRPDVFSDKFAPWYNTQKELEVVIEEGITTIEDFFMQGCAALKKITIPKSVTEIGSLSFASCSKLRTVIWKGDKILSSYIKLLNGNVDFFYFHNNETWKNTKINALCSADSVEILTRLNEWNSSTFTVTGEFYWPMSCDGTMPIIDEGYSAEHGKEGRSNGAHCAVCQEVLIEQQVLPALTVMSTPVATSTPSVTTSPIVGVTGEPTVYPNVEPTPEPSEPTEQAKIPERNWRKNVKVKVGKKFTWSIKVKAKKVKKLKLIINKKGKKLLKVVKRKKIKRGYKITFKAKKKGKTKIKAVIGKEKFTLNVTIKKTQKK